MKRLCSILVLLCLLLPATALASGVAYDAGADTLTIRCDEGLAGEEYALFLLKSGVSVSSMTSADVLFVDQLTADDNGVIEAVFVYPQYPACSAVMGGHFSSGGSPRQMGTYTPQVPQTFNAPGGLLTIEEEAFMNSAFTHVYLAEGVTSIGSRAFAECDNLRYIYIPDATTSIAGDAFEGCEGLTIGCHENSAAQGFAISRGYAYRIVE